MQLTRASKQDWVRILTDPDPPEMARMLHVGQFVTWPKVHNLSKYRRPYAHQFLVAHDRESLALGASNLLGSSGGEERTTRSLRPWVQNSTTPDFYRPPK
jgi:hypothetical protein